MIPIRERVDPLLCRLKSLPAGCAGPSFHAFIEDRQDAIAHDFHDLAAVSVDGQHHAVEIAVECLDDGIRRQHVRHEGEVAQIDELRQMREVMLMIARRQGLLREEDAEGVEPTF